MPDFIYLITVPPASQGDQPLRFVTDDINKVTGKYPVFMIEKLDVI